MKIKQFIALIFTVLFSLSSLGAASLSKAYAAGGSGGGTQTGTITQQSLQNINSATTLAQLKTAVDPFMAQYNMDISFNCPSQSALTIAGDTCTPAADSQFAGFQYDALQTVQEISKLPTDLMQGFSQHTYYFVQSFALSNGSTPDVFDFNFSGPLIHGTGDIREAILHEFYHFYEYYKTGSNFAADPAWTANNPNGFSYGSGGSCTADDTNCTVPARPTGFVDGYATASIAEDKAETFAHLFETTFYPSLIADAQTDTGLAGKVSLMKAFFANIDPSMDDNYYAAIHAYANANYDLPFLSQVTTNQQVTDNHLHGFYVVNNGATLTVDATVGEVTVAQGGTVKGDGSIVQGLFLDAGAIVAPGHSPGCLTVSDLVEGGTYQAELGGTTPCVSNGYDQIIATNSVTLSNGGSGKTGAGAIDGILQVSLYGGFVPKVGNSFTIIDNRSPSAVVDTFQGLPEGAQFTQQGVTYKITYVGGDGNDVVLTVTGVDASRVPRAPNTGFALISAHPTFTIIATLLISISLVTIARRLKVLGN